MGRPLRPVADGLIYHALNRGNNRGAVFFSAEDYRTFLRALAKTKERYPFDLFGYCLMGNHFHLVLRPHDGQTISRILQSLTVAHTWHYHRRRRTCGHVWQGRFKSPVVQDDDHLLTMLRYAESNPLRAGMVKDLADYPWSSYRAHALGETEELLSPPPIRLGVGRTEDARRAFWRDWLHSPLTQKELDRLRRSVTTGRPYGGDAWALQTAKRLGIALGTRPRGRPPKAGKK
jgi:putative transposase